MPAVIFHVRWPDGERQACYSPSTVIYDYFEAGRRYSLPRFLEISRVALTAASARVAERYGGSGCSQALAQLAAIETRVRCQPCNSGEVEFEGFDP